MKKEMATLEKERIKTEKRIIWLREFQEKKRLLRVAIKKYLL